jgi:Flp pilus assembly protein TadG
MKRSERGSNLVEFALVAPVLVFLLIGIADVGRAFYDYISITNAVREGARYAARHPLDPGNTNIFAKTLIERNNADHSLTSCTTTVVPEMDATGQARRVTLRCIFNTITPLIGDFPMTATAAMKVEGP